MGWNRGPAVCYSHGLGIVSGEGVSRDGHRESGDPARGTDRRQDAPAIRTRGSGQRGRPRTHPSDGDPSGRIHRRGRTGSRRGRVRVPSPVWTSNGWSGGLEAHPDRPLRVRLLGRGAASGPLEAFDEAGYEVDFATPNGKRPDALPPSMDPDYIDPPLGTLGHLAGGRREGQGARRLATGSTTRSTSAELMPERPYHSEPTTSCASRRRTTRELDERREGARDKYDAMLIVGGSGPIVDLANNQRVHDLILALLRRRQADRRRVLRRRLPRVRPRLGGPQEHHLAASTSPATATSTTTRTAPASWARTSTWARRRTRSSTSCATPPRPDGALPRQLRPRDVGDRRLPVHHRPLDAGLVPHRRRRWSRCSRTGLRGAAGSHPSAVGAADRRRRWPRKTGTLRDHRAAARRRDHATCSATPARSSRGSWTRSGATPTCGTSLTLQETVAVGDRPTATPGRPQQPTRRPAAQRRRARQRDRDDVPGEARRTRRWS